MNTRIITILLLVFSFSVPAVATEATVYRLAILALTEDPNLRSSFEQDLVADLQKRRFDTISSYEIENDITRVDEPEFVERLRAAGVDGAIVLQPVALGPNSSLKSLQNRLPDELLQNMQNFAKQVSHASEDNLLAIVHLAVYLFDGKTTSMITSGAVWLNEQPRDRNEGRELLRSLIVRNAEAARPGIRKFLGLEPLD